MQHSKAYVFDAFGTLFKVNIPIETLNRHTDGKAGRLLDIWRTKQLEYTWLRTLMDNWVSFDQVTLDALKYATESLDLRNYDALVEQLMPIYHQPDCFEDVIAALQQLKQQKVPIAILSNGTPEMLQAGIQKTGLQSFIDHAFSANAVQQFKVAPAVYQLVLDQLKIEAHEVLFFSSNAWDIAGARRFGFQT
ncbi:MAG: haloacid dehalogenase type II, partial [Bacteroidota bacterium]